MLYTTSPAQSPSAENPFADVDLLRGTNETPPFEPVIVCTPTVSSPTAQAATETNDKIVPPNIIPATMEDPPGGSPTTIHSPAPPTKGETNESVVHGPNDAPTKPADPPALFTPSRVSQSFTIALEVPDKEVEEDVAENHGGKSEIAKEDAKVRTTKPFYAQQ